MPDPANYPMRFRPADYTSGPAAALARVKVARRRRLVEDAIRDGRLAEVPSESLNEAAPLGVRAVLEALDFRSMGGEYLPPLRPGETEVARVEMPTTTTHDVISVRARRTARGYTYRVVDEYEGRWHCRPATSRLPLTMRKLVGLIHSAYLVGEEDGQHGVFYARWWGVYEDGRDPAEFRHFYRVTSPLYPALKRWFDEEAAERVAEQREGRAERWCDSASSGRSGGAHGI